MRNMETASAAIYRILVSAGKSLYTKIMTDRNALLQEIETLPPEYMGTVIDFVSYLKHRNLNGYSGGISAGMSETMLQSESALAKDWNTPEEDAAWSLL
jgi:hypothetical protein